MSTSRHEPFAVGAATSPIVQSTFVAFKGDDSACKRARARARRRLTCILDGHALDETDEA